jgi:HK97 family phage portal protein
VNLWGRQQRAADLGALAGPPIPPPSAGARWGGRVIVRSSDTALRHAAVWAATRFRSDLLGSLPVDVYKRTASGRPVQIDPPSVLVKPTATDRIDEFLVMGEMSQCLRGNAVGVIVSRDRLQYPTQIELVHPDEWALRRDPLTGAIVEARVGGKRIEMDELWLAPANRIAGVPWGLAPISYAAAQIGLGLSALEFGLEWFGDGIHPTAVLESDQSIEQDDAVKIKRRVVDVQRGSREPLVLGKGLTWRSIRVSADESQFLATQRASASDVCRVFGVPPELLGYAESGSSVTYANRESRALDYLAFHFGATVRRWERTLSALVPRGQYVKLNTAALLQTDLLTRYRAYALGIGSKFLHPDEARDREDMGPLTPEQVADLAALDVKAPTGGAADQKGGA